jgi:hypothetical protein
MYPQLQQDQTPFLTFIPETAKHLRGALLESGSDVTDHIQVFVRQLTALKTG